MRRLMKLWSARRMKSRKLIHPRVRVETNDSFRLGLRVSVRLQILTLGSRCVELCSRLLWKWVLGLWGICKSKSEVKKWQYKWNQCSISNAYLSGRYLVSWRGLVWVTDSSMLVIGILIGIWIGDYYWVVYRIEPSQPSSGHCPPPLTRLLNPPLFNPPLRVALLPFFKPPLREARPAFLDIRRWLLR